MKIERIYVAAIQQVLQIDTIAAKKLALKIREEYYFIKTIIDAGCDENYAVGIAKESNSIIAHKI